MKWKVVSFYLKFKSINPTKNVFFFLEIQGKWKYFENWIRTGKKSQFIYFFRYSIYIHKYIFIFNFRKIIL